MFVQLKNNCNFESNKIRVMKTHVLVTSALAENIIFQDMEESVNYDCLKTCVTSVIEDRFTLITDGNEPIRWIMFIMGKECELTYLN